MNQSLSYEIAQVMPAAYASGLFVAFASFVEPVQTQGPTGNPVSGNYLPLGGLQGIPAMNAPNSEIRVSSDETRALTHIEAKRERHMLLKGFYVSLNTGFGQGAGLGWQASVQEADGSVNLYDFTGGEADSQSQMTRVRMMLVTT